MAATFGFRCFAWVVKWRGQYEVETSDTFCREWSRQKAREAATAGAPLEGISTRRPGARGPRASVAAAASTVASAGAALSSRNSAGGADFAQPRASIRGRPAELLSRTAEASLEAGLTTLACAEAVSAASLVNPRVPAAGVVREAGTRHRAESGHWPRRSSIRGRPAEPPEGGAHANAGAGTHGESLPGAAARRQVEAVWPFPPGVPPAAQWAAALRPRAESVDRQQRR
jgi:hypothetical protein